MAFLDLSRMGDSDNLARGISDLAAVGDDGGGVVTAVRTLAGRLKLIHWEIDSTGVRRLGDSGDQAREATNLAMAKHAKHVVAYRTGAGTLKLISWDVASDGPITRSGDSGSQADAVTVIRMVALGDGTFVVACRGASGNLKLITWQLNTDGSLTRLADGGSAPPEAVSEIALIDVSTAGGRVLTAVRASSGHLKLITWRVTASGAITRLVDSGDQAGEASLIRAVRTSVGQVVTSVRDGNGNLKLISWLLPADDSAINLQGDSNGQAGEIGDNALLALEDGVVSAVRTGSGELKLISWAVGRTGSIVRRGDSGHQAGKATLIHLQPGTQAVDLAGRSVTMITPVRTASGTLKLITWGPTCVRVHIKILTTPNVNIGTMVASMRAVYDAAGITVNRLTTETLNLPLLTDVDIGECVAGETTAEQDQLFANRNDVGPNDVVVYFVRSTIPATNGCAVHPDGRPGAVVTQTATRWTMAHEIGHVLGLPHCDTGGQCELDRLMTGCGTANITNPPPDLIAAEVGTMQGSSLTVGCLGIP